MRFVEDLKKIICDLTEYFNRHMADNIRDFYYDWCDYERRPHHLHHDNTGDGDVHYRWEVMDIHRIPG